MRVLQDYQMFIRQRFGGVSRYHYELYRGLNRKGIKTDIIAMFSRCEYLKKKQKVYLYQNKTFRDALLLFNDIITFLCILVAAIIGKKYDIIHVTWYRPFYLDWIKLLPESKRPKIVMTVYDLIQERILEEYPYMRNAARDKKRMLDKVDGIICISENTKKDLLEYYPKVMGKQVKTIHLASAKMPKAKGRGMMGKYILYVGSRESYKNFGNFIRATVPILRKYNDLFVCCIGGGQFDTEEMKLLKELNVEKRVIQRDVFDEELSNYYTYAECFVYPSLYEGFGIPILEAFQCKCPVLLHSGECFKEVAGSAALYFDGHSVKSITDALQSIIANEKKRNELMTEGIKRLRCYSWKKTTEETIAFYQKLCGREE